MAALPAGWEHGYSAYGNGHCRCDICRAAFTAYIRQRRDRLRGQPLPEHVAHGTRSTYSNYMCRCNRCKAANTAASRAWRARRKAVA